MDLTANFVINFLMFVFLFFVLLPFTDLFSCIEQKMKIN